MPNGNKPTAIGVRFHKRKVEWFMGKGPKWSDAGVRELVQCLRIRLEAVDMMSEERLEKECRSRGLVIEKEDDRATMLKDWFWDNVVGDSLQERLVEKENEVREVKQPVLIDPELEKVVELLKKEHTATEGGIKNALFVNREKVFKAVMDHGLATGKIRRIKTTSGMEMIVLV
jgi:hypothetical protein